MGWICVALGACVPLVGVGRLYRGFAVSWWEPFVLVGLGGAVVLVGLALALPNPGPRFAVLALSTWGAMLMTFGVVALLVPAEVLVTHGRGPRTVFTAQLRGGLNMVIGGILISTALALERRRRKQHTPTHRAADETFNSR